MPIKTLQQILQATGIEPNLAARLVTFASNDPANLSQLTPGILAANHFTTTQRQDRRLLAIAELIRQSNTPRQPRAQISHASIQQDLLPWTAKMLETLWVYSLDCQTPHPGVIGIDQVYVGNRNAIPISSAEIYRPAVQHGATRIIVAHTHCNDEAHPSADDITAAKAIETAGQALEIDIVDFVIVSRSSFYSLAQAGLI